MATRYWVNGAGPFDTELEADELWASLCKVTEQHEAAGNVIKHSSIAVLPSFDPALEDHHRSVSWHKFYLAPFEPKHLPENE